MVSFYINKLLRKILMRPAVRSSVMDPTARLGIMCNMSYSEMGCFSYAGDYTAITHAKIGNYTSISSNCIIGGGEHPTNWVSTSPVFNSNRSILSVSFSDNDYSPYKTTYIGNDVWIGTHCVIKSGVTIADGAVIGMGSVVTKDIGPYEIWVGNPARLIKKRFNDNTIQRLLQLHWWDWSNEKICRKAALFCDVDSFFREGDN